MRIALSILVILSATTLAQARYPGVGQAPKVTCEKALSAATREAGRHGAPADRYVDQMKHIVPEKESLWIVWVASPSKGYTILAVDEKGRVRTATRKEIDTARGVTSK